MLGKAFLRIVQQLLHDIVVLHVGIFGQIIAERLKQADLLRSKVGLGNRIFLRVWLAPVNARFNRTFRYAAVKTDPEVHLLRLKSGGQIVVHHKINAVFVGSGHRWPGAGVIQVGIEILCPVRHVVGHQVDIVEQRGDGFDIHPAFRTFRIRAHCDGHQLFLPERVAHLFQQGGEVIPVGGLACNQPPGAVDRILPVEIDPVQTVFLNNLLRGADKHRATLFGCRCARETTRAPAANGEQDFQVRVLFTQGGDKGQIGRHFWRQPDLMQFRRIFQRGVGFVFLVVINKTKRVVQVGDLANVEFIDIATRSGGDIATPVKVAHGHQGRGGSK